jgi:aminopeptidase N
MNILICILCVFTLIYHTTAQYTPSIVLPSHQEEKHELCSHAHGIKQKLGETTLNTKSEIDVLTYHVFMDWRLPFATPDSVLPTYTYSGINELTFLPLSSLSTITLNAASMIIDSVSLNGIMLPAISILQPANGIWSINLTTPLSLDTHSLHIWYTYKGDAKRGFYYYPKGLFVRKFQGLDSNFVEEDLAYVMNQPEDARFWMPCNDRPDDKARATITIRVPYDSTLSDTNNIRVTSNGDLIHREIGRVNGNAEYRDYTFYDTTLIPTYLMVVNASKFVDFTLWAKVPNSTDSIPIYNYVWKKDFDGTKIDGSEYNARHALSYTPSMITGYIPLFGKYPFTSYGHTSAQPFWAGGMEHQRMSTINRTWLRGWSSNGLAHEVMHQWFGDLVTCETWGEIWLNEGAGTWGEALWYETWGGYPEYISMMRAKRNDYLRINANQLQPPIFGIPIENIFNYATTYAKASWVYHMLRTMLGDDIVYPVLRTYLNTYAYGNANTEDFKNIFKKEAPNPAIDYDVFFDQWLNKRGHPILRFSTLREHINPQQGTYIHFIVNQIQQGNNVPSAFQFPLSIRFIGMSDTVMYRGIVRDAQHEGFVQLKSPLVKAIIDPNSDVLLEADSISGTYLSVKESIIAPQAQIHTIGNQHFVSINSMMDEQLTIIIHDIRGRQVHSELLSIGSYQKLEKKLPQLDSGMYIVTIRSQQGVISLRLLQ